jgi:hypothetical protein
MRGVCQPSNLEDMVLIYTKSVIKVIVEGTDILTNSSIQISDGDEFLFTEISNTFRRVFSGKHEYSPFLLQDENEITPEWMLPYLSRFMVVFDNTDPKNIQVNVSHDLMKLDRETNTFNPIELEDALKLRSLN